MGVYQTTIQSGRVKEIYRYECIRVPNEYRRGRVLRMENRQKSSERQMRANLFNAKKKLWRLINCNFTENDYFYTLTYRSAADAENAEKEIKNFIRRLKRFCEKSGIPQPRYIGVTETGEGDEARRAHHHLILSGSINPTEINRIWGKGKVISALLDPTENYEGLTQYIAKEFGLSSEHKKRWIQSRNLVQPKIIRKKLTGRGRPIGSVKGHKIISHDWESNEFGFREYVVAVKNAPPPRHKKKNRLSKRK